MCHRTHEALLRERKRACMRCAYWGRGGRQKRLDRYVKKKPRRSRQLTLLESVPPCELERAASPTPPQT